VATPSALFPLPIVLWENLFETAGATVTPSTEIAGFPWENVLDWSPHTGSRWRIDSSVETAGPIDDATATLTVDLGVGNTAAATCIGWAGSNRTAVQLAGGNEIFVTAEHSTDGIAWTVPNGAANRRVLSGAGMVEWDQVGAFRYWRAKIYTPASADPFPIDPQFGVLVLGRALYLSGVPPSMGAGFNSERFDIELTDNEKGDNLGANIEAIRTQLRLRYDSAGLSRDGFLNLAAPAAHEVDFDNGLVPHIKLGRHFLLGWIRPQTSVPTIYDTFLVRSDRVSQPFIGTTKRRGVALNLTVYDEGRTS